MFRPPPLGAPETIGDLQRFPIPRLLFFLLKKAFLGTVTIESSVLNGRVYFRDGMPVFTDVASTRDVLGRVLLERGAINEQTFNRSLQELAQTGQLQGQILLRLGAIDQRTLIEGLRLQLYRKLNRLFALVEAKVAIFPGEHGIGLDGELAMVQADPLLVIHQGVRNCLDADRLELELSKLQGQLIRLRSGFERRQARYGLTEEEQALAVFLAGQAHSIQNVLRLSHLLPLQTLMVIYTLWVTEALATAPDPEAALRPSAPAAESAPVMRPAPAAVPAPATAVPSVPPPVLVSTSAVPTPVLVTPPVELTGAPTVPSVTITLTETGAPPVLPAPIIEAGLSEAPQVQDLARAFSTGMLDAVTIPIPPVLKSPVAVITPPPPELEPIPIEPTSVTTPLPSSPVPLVDAELSASPIIVPPPSIELDPMPIIVPPPPESAPAPAPLITPPPPAIITPPPDMAAEAVPLVTPLPDQPDAPLPHLTSTLDAGIFAEEPASGRQPASPAPADATAPSGEASRGRRISQSIAGVPSPQALADHKALLRRTEEQIKDKDHFQVLEIQRDASLDQVRDAYFRLAKLYHPDRCTAMGLFDMAPVAEEIFRRINEAHAVLTDPEGRKKYEADLDGGGGDKSDARKALEAEFSFQKGVIFFRKKNYAEALRCFREAWKLNDKEGEHLAWIAWTQFHDPKIDKSTALPHIKEQMLQAMSIAPQNPVCHYYLGEIYLACGDEKRAKTCFTRTVELQESHVEANRHLRLMQMRKEKASVKEKKGLFGGLLKKK